MPRIKANPDPLELLAKIDPGSKAVLNVVRRTMELAGICEEEIDRARKRYTLSGRRKEIDDSFKLLKPTDLFLDRVDEIYRHHCRELLRRMAKGRDTRPGTKAEVMLALSATSLLSPLKHDPFLLYAELFKEIMGKDIMEDTGTGGETYQGATSEILNTMRKKLTADWRRSIKGKGGHARASKAE